MKTRKLELARKIYNQKTINEIDTKINLLGSACKFDAVFFLNVRLLPQ